MTISSSSSRVGRHGGTSSRWGEVIARLSRAIDPFVRHVLTRLVAEVRPGRILDVGCGSGTHLAHLLQLAPEATGAGLGGGPGRGGHGREALHHAGLSGRATEVEGPAREVRDAFGGDGFDLALLANIIYHLPPAERVPLRAVADRTRPGDAVVVVTPALTDSLFSRHFDLLLRTQQGSMGLPDLTELPDQLRSAGLVPQRPRRVAPGEPLTAVVAYRSSGG